jgi:hypothetical protein
VPPEHHAEKGKRGRSKSPSSKPGTSYGNTGSDHSLQSGKPQTASSSSAGSRKLKSRQQASAGSNAQPTAFLTNVNEQPGGLYTNTDDDAGSVTDIFPLYNYSLMDMDGDNDYDIQANNAGRASKSRRSNKLSPSKPSGGVILPEISPSKLSQTQANTQANANTNPNASSSNLSVSASAVSGGSAAGMSTRSNNAAAAGTSGRGGSSGGGGGASVSSKGSSVPLSLRPPGPGEYRREYSEDHPVSN